MSQDSNKKKIRYPYLDNPFGFVLPQPKPMIHPKINNWDDFTDEDKKKILLLKSEIESIMGKCELSIFGSRIKGNWDNQSDYDLIIHNDVDIETKKLIRDHKYTYPCDISFGNINHDSVKII
jgi:hypothetical protein